MDSCNNSAQRGGTFSIAGDVRITSLSPDRVCAELLVSENSMNPWGIVHGGCLATLADTAAGSLVSANGYQCVTLSCALNYLRPGTGKVIYAVAVPRKLGRTVSVVEVTLTDEQDRQVMSGTFTLYNTAPLTEETLAALRRRKNYAPDM